jgi:hypothetical protein
MFSLRKKFMDAVAPAAKAIGRFYTRHYNRIQFASYEPFNVLLAGSQTLLGTSASLGGVNAETAAALSFLIGSGLIWKFHPDKKPTNLFYGGLALAAGGGCLAGAGYELSGLSVTIASLETARGGLKFLNEKIKSDAPVTHFTRRTHNLGQKTMLPYTLPVESLSARFKNFGRFINERPFVTGAIIKIPCRLDYIIGNAAQGNVLGMIGALVGLAWANGDVALAFNDEKLRDQVAEYSKPDAPITPHNYL